MKLSGVSINRKPVYMALLQGLVCGLLLTLASTRHFMNGAVRGLTILAFLILTIAVNLILNTFLLPYKLKYLKRTGLGVISFFAALFPFITFEIIYTPFAFNRTSGSFLIILFLLSAIGLIASLVLATFIKRGMTWGNRSKERV